MENYLRRYRQKLSLKIHLCVLHFYSGNVLCEQIWLPSCGHGVCLVYALFPRLSFGSNQLHSPNYPYEYNGNTVNVLVLERQRQRTELELPLHTYRTHKYIPIEKEVMLCSNTLTICSSCEVNFHFVATSDK